MAGEAAEIAKFAALMAIAPGLVQKETANGINRAAAIVNRQRYRNTPVRTGKLRREWTATKATPTSLMSIIGTNVPYAPFIEFGTSRMSARQPLQNAMNETNAEVEKAYADIPANVVKALQAGGR